MHICITNSSSDNIVTNVSQKMLLSKVLQKTEICEVSRDDFPNHMERRGQVNLLGEHMLLKSRWNFHQKQANFDSVLQF